MIINERENRQERIEAAAQELMTAARTAPKGRGSDNIEICTLTAESITQLAQAMRELYKERPLPMLLRDADNLDQSSAVVLVGYRPAPMGLDCGYCGFATCAERAAESSETPCSLNEIDLGIAVGSMVSKAADLRLDNRVMFSAGYAAPRLGLLEGCRSILALPLSVSSKSPYFDRIVKS